MKKKLYPCDYKKNKECPKTHCMYFNRGECCSTDKKEYAIKQQQQKDNANIS